MLPLITFNVRRIIIRSLRVCWRHTCMIEGVVYSDIFRHHVQFYYLLSYTYNDSIYNCYICDKSWQKFTYIYQSPLTRMLSGLMSACRTLQRFISFRAKNNCCVYERTALMWRPMSLPYFLSTSRKFILNIRQTHSSHHPNWFTLSASLKFKLLTT